ncbi:hypothetical protein ACLOJK_040870, partial [Asimina triloba]
MTMRPAAHPAEDAVRSSWLSAAASSDGDRCLKTLSNRLGFGHALLLGRTMLGLELPWRTLDMRTDGAARRRMLRR